MPRSPQDRELTFPMPIRSTPHPLYRHKILVSRKKARNILQLHNFKALHTNMHCPPAVVLPAMTTTSARPTTIPLTTSPCAVAPALVAASSSSSIRHSDLSTSITAQPPRLSPSSLTGPASRHLRQASLNDVLPSVQRSLTGRRRHHRRNHSMMDGTML